MDSGAAVKVAVLGAGGTIAPAIVRDLADSPEVSRLQLLDLDEERAAAVAQAHGGGKASASAVDARDTGALAAAVGEADVLLNTASYRVNLHAMRGALEAGCHYLDLGGLYWMTARQLVLSGDFERAGLLAVLGIGSSPGKTNLMARHVVHQLGDEVESIEIVAAGRDPAAPADGRLRPPYAIQTLLDELTLQPVVLRDGQAIEIEPLSSGGTVDVGEPIGRVQTIYTLHSELATFADSFGCRQASFRLSLAPPALDALTELAGATVETVNAAARQAASPSNETISVQVVIVRTSGGRTATMRAVTRPHFGLGGSIVSTAAPAAATVRLFARGSLRSAGAHPPERCIDPEEMFAELRERGCTFSVE
jgi:saccharopine dehydrogenase (NAD+, L-lysine-forming)